MSLTAASVTVLSATSNGWSGPSAGGWIPDVFARRLLAESAGSPSGFSGMPVLRVGGPCLAHDSGPRSRAGSLVLTGCDYSAPPDESLPATVMRNHLSMRGSVIASPDASWLNLPVDQGDSFRC